MTNCVFEGDEFIDVGEIVGIKEERSNEWKEMELYILFEGFLWTALLPNTEFLLYITGETKINKFITKEKRNSMTFILFYTEF